MANMATTRVSSKGQVVIAEDIRKQLRSKAGSQFIVLGKDDVVIHKAISPPTMEEFDSLITAARKRAKKPGMERSDIPRAIARVRGTTVRVIPDANVFVSGVLFSRPPYRIWKPCGMGNCNWVLPRKSL